MRKIIEARAYDTTTAELLAEYSQGVCWRDFHYYEENLYRKKTGEYFLHGRGGAMTKYSERNDCNSWSGGERITPMTEDEAKEWAEDHLSAEEYETIFGICEE